MLDQPWQPSDQQRSALIVCSHLEVIGGKKIVAMLMPAQQKWSRINWFSRSFFFSSQNFRSSRLLVADSFFPTSLTRKSVAWR